MSSTLFAVLAIGVAGFLGASVKGDSKARGGMVVVFVTGFVLLCVAIGYMTGINPARVMAICGLAFAALLVVAFLSNGDK